MDLHPHSTPLRILVVDDEPSVRLVLSDFLREEGHEITTASNGTEALETFHQAKWDMVLTDRAMPGMTGDELAAAVKESDPHMPVVMITGNVDPKRDFVAAPRQVDVVVRKPFTLAAIRNAMSEATAACR
jgi:CheY-like chemotaxis protein